MTSRDEGPPWLCREDHDPGPRALRATAQSAQRSSRRRVPAAVGERGHRMALLPAHVAEVGAKSGCSMRATGTPRSRPRVLPARRSSMPDPRGSETADPQLCRMRITKKSFADLPQPPSGLRRQVPWSRGRRPRARLLWCAERPPSERSRNAPCAANLLSERALLW